MKNDKLNIEVKQVLMRCSTTDIIRLCESFLLAKERGQYTESKEDVFSLIKSELKARNYPLIKIKNVEVKQN